MHILQPVTRADELSCGLSQFSKYSLPSDDETFLHSPPYNECFGRHLLHTYFLEPDDSSNLYSVQFFTYVILYLA